MPAPHQLAPPSAAAPPQMADDGSEPPQRRRLVLKPRDPAAAAKLEEEQRQKAASAKASITERFRASRCLPPAAPGAGGGAGRNGAGVSCRGRPRDARGAPFMPMPRALQNPFGAAKPREAIIAARVGKTEEEVRGRAV